MGIKIEGICYFFNSPDRKVFGGNTGFLICWLITSQITPGDTLGEGPDIQRNTLVDNPFRFRKVYLLHFLVITVNYICLCSHAANVHSDLWAHFIIKSWIFIFFRYVNCIIILYNNCTITRTLLFLFSFWV
jgi:hypothetical protein